jgi:hypothetical protein
MTLYFDGEREDLQAAREAADRLAGLRSKQDGAELVIANEFSEVRIAKVHTRNGSRLLIESPRSGQWIALCPLELEALTWQSTQTFSAMVGNPFRPLIDGPAEE